MNKNALTQKYNSSRNNLLLMIAFTVVNIILFATGSDTMWLFSATIPYISAGVGIILGYYHIPLIIAAVLILLYLLSWFLSKKHYAWMIVAAVLFVIDTIYMAYLYIDSADTSGILDAAIHIWVLYYLVTGIYYGWKLKKLPLEAEEPELSDAVLPEAASPNSTPLRLAEDVKHRVFVEADYNSHHICYRRVKSTNELVIDGYVYGEYKMLIEPAHSISATIDSHTITAGYDGKFHSYIKVDSQQIAKKLRLY